MVLLASTELRAGDEVTIDYGYLPISKFAVKYGFALDGLPMDAIKYPAPLLLLGGARTLEAARHGAALRAQEARQAVAQREPRCSVSALAAHVPPNGGPTLTRTQA